MAIGREAGRGARPDRRVARSRRALKEALTDLILERGYEAVTVQDVIDRADVGRSTFYAHFRDKDELLAEGIRDLLREAGSAAPPATRKTEWVLRFSAPMFEHIGRYVPANGPGLATRHEDSLHEHLEHAIAASVAESLRRAGGTEGIVCTELLAEHVAATFVRVLEWWIAGGTRRSASEAEAAFRALVLPALRAALGER